MAQFTRRLAYKLADTSVRLNKYHNSLKKFLDDNRRIIQKIVSGEEMPAQDFLILYDKANI